MQLRFQDRRTYANGRTYYCDGPDDYSTDGLQMSEQIEELEEETPRGTLKVGEVHPMAHSAFEYVKNFLTMNNMGLIVESLASIALSGNRNAEVCLETVQRIMAGDVVSDRYLLGLAWMFKQMEENETHSC